MKALLIALVAACGSSRAPATQPAATPPPVAAPAGKSQVLTERFHSDALGVDKDVRIYLPAGYDPAGSKRYPVIYYLHGLGRDENDWLEYGKIDQVADELSLGAIIVMPDGDNNFYFDSALATDFDGCIKDGAGMFVPTQNRRKTCVKTSHYETYMLKDLIGWVDRTYKTNPKREGRGIAGLSMGGFGALMLAMRHPDVFAATASHSGVDALLYMGPFPYEKGKVQLLEDVGQWGKLVGKMGDWIRGLFGNDIATWRAHDPSSLAQKLAPGQLAIYLDCGTEDIFALHNGMQYLHDLLLERKIEHEYFIGPGGHDFNFWKPRLPKSLAFFKAKLAPAS